LLKQNPSRRIRLLERLPRRGQLETDHVLIDGVRIKTEEGMLPSSHVELVAPSRRWPVQDIVPFPMGGPNNLYTCEASASRWAA
jgi:hypothetical protein